MADSRDHCEACVFANFEPAETDLVRRLEAKMVIDYSVGIPDRALESAGLAYGMTPERQEAARTCGRAMMNNTCLWAQAETVQGAE